MMYNKICNGIYHISVLLICSFLIFSLSGCDVQEFIQLIEDKPWPNDDIAYDQYDYDDTDSGQYDENTDQAMDEADDFAESATLDTDGMMRYMYNTLNDNEKQLYREIYSILNTQADKVKLSSLDADLVDRIFSYVMDDHPEFFYVTGFSLDTYSVNGKKTELLFSGTYNRTIAQTDDDKLYLDEYSERVFSSMPDFDDEYETAKYIYTYIIENTEYDLNAPDNQNVISVFKNGKSVCNGYARATQYLLNKAGISCIMVSGRANGGPHAWNIACIDGVWTNIDTTWGDVSYRNVTTGDTWNETTYDYFCISADEISKTHTVEGNISLPETVSIDG